MNAEIHFVSFDIKHTATSDLTKIIREKFWNLNNSNIKGDILILSSLILNENCFFVYWLYININTHTHTQCTRTLIVRA
jgi:hypothetical protein